MPARATATNSASASARSTSASIQSDSRAKCRSPSGLARWWISSRSTCSSMSSGVVRSVGTATSVRNDSGTPPRRSRPGNGTGRTKNVTPRLTSVTPASIAEMAAANREHCDLNRAEAHPSKRGQRNRQNDRGHGHDRRGVSNKFLFCRDARRPAPNPTKANRGLEFAACLRRANGNRGHYAVVAREARKTDGARAPPRRRGARSRVRRGVTSAPGLPRRFGRGCGSQNPFREMRTPRPGRHRRDDSVRTGLASRPRRSLLRLVTMLRTVTFAAPWLRWTSRTAKSAVRPCFASRSSSQASAGVNFGFDREAGARVGPRRPRSAARARPAKTTDAGSAARPLTPRSRSARLSASCRAVRLSVICCASRLRFSINTICSVIETAQSSPIVRDWTS